MYKIISTCIILRISDNVYIPTDLGNEDYKAYLQWLEAGNTPLPADPEPVIYPHLSTREFLKLFTKDEKLAVKAATSVSDEVGLWYDEMLAAEYITLEDEDTEVGLNSLLAAELITQARYDEIYGALMPIQHQ